MAKIEDITGKQFGYLTAICFDGHDKHNTRLWKCKCVCGKEIHVTVHNLKCGHTKSCGCQRHTSKTKHGMWNTRIFRIWKQLCNRCTKKSHIQYKDYGGRGITVCKEWLEDVKNFAKWAYENGYSDDLTIDRIDNNKGYSPENCRWTTLLEQANNKRNNRHLTLNGETHTMAEWSRIVGINYGTIRSRVYAGWSDYEVLTTPVNSYV